MPALQDWIQNPGAAKRFRGWGSNAASLDQYAAEVRNGEYGIGDVLRPLGFSLKKVLGKGGFGVACLFEMTGVDGQTTRIVVKACTNRAAMVRERDNSEDHPGGLSLSRKKI